MLCVCKLRNWKNDKGYEIIIEEKCRIFKKDKFQFFTFALCLKENNTWICNRSYVLLNLSLVYKEQIDWLKNLFRWCIMGWLGPLWLLSNMCQSAEYYILILSDLLQMKHKYLTGNLKTNLLDCYVFYFSFIWVGKIYIIIV